MRCIDRWMLYIRRLNASIVRFRTFMLAPLTGKIIKLQMCSFHNGSEQYDLLFFAEGHFCLCWAYMHMSSAFGRRYAGEYKGMEWLLCPWGAGNSRDSPRLLNHGRQPLTWIIPAEKNLGFYLPKLALSLPKSPNFSCSLTRNITSHSMKNLAFHSLLRWKLINNIPILTTSLIRLGEYTFWAQE